LSGVSANAAVTILRLDEDHGNVLKVYDAMGRPDDPTREQILALRRAGRSSEPEQTHLKDGNLSVSIPPQGLVVVTVTK